MFLTQRAPAHTLRAGDYRRISDDKKAGTAEEGRGVQRQDEINTARIRVGGWQHVVSLVDNDMSATSTRKKRPGFTELLRMVRARELDVVVASHFDRLCRRPVEAAELFDAMADAGCLLVISQGGELDMGSAIGRMVAEILAVVARMEVALKAERQVNGNIQRRGEGKAFGGGRAPFGYTTASLEEVDPAQAVLIQGAYAHVLAGGSLRSVAESWQRKGFDFTVTGIRGMLTHPRYAGILAHRGEEIGPGTWPALVSEDDFREAQLVLGDPARLSHSGAGRKYLLAGLIYCGVCAAAGEDHALTTGWITRKNKAGPKRVRLYVCEPTEHLGRVAGNIEDVVLEKVWRRLSQRDALELLIRPERTNITMLRARANKLRRGKENVLDLVADGEFTRFQADARLAKINKELAEIDAVIHDAPSAPTLEALIRAGEDAGKSLVARAEAVKATWEGMDLAQQRATVKLLVKVTVDKGGRGRRFEADSVRVEYLV